MASKNEQKPRTLKRNRSIYQISVVNSDAYEDAKLWIGIAQAVALWLIFLTLYLHWY